MSARRESASARTLVLSVPHWPGHLPGQHVDLRLTAPDGYSTQRSYSIASPWVPPASESVIELTVEQVEGGEVSPYLVDVFSVGDPIELRGPVGGWFVWSSDDPAAALLAAGGSGIVPLMAMLRARRAAGSRAPFRLVYSVRSPEAVMYADELAALAAGDGSEGSEGSEGSGGSDHSHGSGVEVEIAYTRTAPHGWPGPVGRVRSEQLLAPVGGRAVEAAFVCGPTGFVEAVADRLAVGGVDPGVIKTERFGPTGG